MTLTNLKHPKHPCPTVAWNPQEGRWELPGGYHTKNKSKARAVMTRHALKVGYKLQEAV